MQTKLFTEYKGHTEKCQVKYRSIEGKGIFQKAEPSHWSLILAFSLHTGRLRNLLIASHPQLYENGTCEIHLTCYVENPNDNVSLRWQASGNTLSSEANLTISRDLKNFSEQNYTCIAENPVSHLSSSVSARSLCKGNGLSQVSLRALSSCELWCVLIHYVIPKTPFGVLYLSLSPEV